jgi:hypothetical protein
MFEHMLVFLCSALLGMFLYLGDTIFLLDFASKIP